VTVPAVAAEPVREGLVVAGGLLAGRCATCAALHFPRRGLCPECQGDRIDEAVLSATGRVYTFTIVRMTPPGYSGETPYAVGVVELPDGLRVTSTITAADLEELEIGDAVDFEVIAVGDVSSFAFRRRESGS
jgi:uncharacterized OB-fold protein